MKNDFSQETRNLFMWNYECWVCGGNKWDALHHVLGRVSDSPLNAAPIHNADCHIGKSFSDEDKKAMLEKTIKWLVSQSYKLTQRDIDFITDNIKYYEK